VAGGQGGETIEAREIKRRARRDANCRAAIVLIRLQSGGGEAYRGVTAACYKQGGEAAPMMTAIVLHDLPPSIGLEECREHFTKIAPDFLKAKGFLRKQLSC
jgi:hypothetical protein